MNTDLPPKQCIPLYVTSVWIIVWRNSYESHVQNNCGGVRFSSFVTCVSSDIAVLWYRQLCQRVWVTTPLGTSFGNVDLDLFARYMDLMVPLVSVAHQNPRPILSQYGHQASSVLHFITKSWKSFQTSANNALFWENSREFPPSREEIISLLVSKTMISLYDNLF